jgi:hypothetical protein
MKILRIQLHPFGGVVDRIVELHDGLNVIERPNEFGKSTLNNALWHALFTPSKLTPKKRELTIGRWFPKPSGDHVRVTLDFEAQGQRWTLQKCWGVGESSSLRSSDAAAIAEPTSVQEKLSQLLQRNEATWRNVLFVNQAQLNNTIDELKNNSAQIDDLEPLLAGVAAIPGDIAEDKLAKALDDRIEVHFSRWDINTGGPEKGKGIDNPFKNKIGPQLAAYYAMEITRREREKVFEFENNLDEIHSKIREQEALIEKNREFVATGCGLRDGLLERDGIEQRIRNLKIVLDALQVLLVEWPQAEQNLHNKQNLIAQVNAAIGDLKIELAIAKKREAAGQLREDYKQLVKARENWKAALENLRKAKEIPTALLEELKGISKAIDELRIQIAAQKLIARLEGKSLMSVRVTRGTETTEVVELVPGAHWEEQAEGKFCVELENLRIDVASGTGEVQSLFDQLDGKTARQTKILEELGLKDLAAVEAAKLSYQQCVIDENLKKQLYEAALKEKTEEQWAAEIAELDGLPPTRSVAELEGKIAQFVENWMKLNYEIQELQNKLEQWRIEHTDLKTLMAKVTKKSIELAELENQLAALPQVPDGFESVKAYLEELTKRQKILEDAKETLQGLKIKQAQLIGTAPSDRTAEELREELESKEREFQRQGAAGKALLRIRAKLQEIVASSGAGDPMQGLASTVAGHFKNLTCGRYDGVKLDGATPVEISGPLVLETALLSQGTLGSLAVATRLALAELYLDDMEGFLVLDDPFTDMDPARRIAAGRCLGEFAKRCQVLFFTCHPEHRRELEEHAGAEAPCING